MAADPGGATAAAFAGRRRSTLPWPVTPAAGRVPSWALPAAVTGLGWTVLLATPAPDATAGHALHLRSAVAMTAAMMGPLAIPMCRITARTSLWRHATRNTLIAFLTFMGAWSLVATLLHGVAESVTAVVPGTTAAVGLAAWCAAAQLRHSRDARLRACDVGIPLRPSSGRRDSVTLGTRTAIRCTRTCLPAMAIMALRPHAVWVAVVATLLLGERVVTPRRRSVLAVAYLALGVAIAASSALAG